MLRHAKLILVLALPACGGARAVESAATPAPAAVHGEVVGHDAMAAHGRMMHERARGTRIAVNAQGSASSAPEQAVVQLAVETAARTAQEAAEQNAERMTRLVAALRRLDIPEDRIRTTSYNMYPEYRHDENRSEPRIIGYRVMNQVSVTVDGPSRAGAVIDAALEAGANRVDGLTFQLEDAETVRAEALREAMAKARAEAELLAAAAGLTLGEPVEISTSFGYAPPPRPMYMERAMAQDAATPVQPGTVEVQAMVSIVYLAQP